MSTRFLVLFGIALFLGCGPASESAKESLRQEMDRESGQKESLSQTHIDSVLALFPKVKFRDLPEPHKSRMFPDEKFNAEMQQKSFLEIRGMQPFIRIVGPYRIESFLPKDEFSKANLQWLAGNREGLPPAQYWLVDKRMLYKLAELIRILREEGYQERQIHVAHGYRYPAYNTKVGGASRSRHVFGDAVDLDIGDIDGNGIAEYTDKQIVYDLLNEKLIRQAGGLGRYPHAEHRVHFDLRGYGARWDTY